MEIIYSFFIALCLVFLSELGDKTQILVLSFSAKYKASKILLGIALGTFFSHGLAILFGSQLNYSNFGNGNLSFYLKLFTYISFLFFGIIGFIPKKSCDLPNDEKHNFLSNLLHMNLGCIFTVAINIIVGELGDKTFLASLGLGLEYPNCKLSLIVGSIAGMLLSNGLAIFFGKFLQSKLNKKFVVYLSNFLFIILGVAGLISLL